MKKQLIYLTLIVAFVLSSCAPPKGIPVTGASPTKVKATGTHTRVVTATPTGTATATSTPAHAHTGTATDTPAPTGTQAVPGTPDTNPDLVIAYPDAPACADNNGDGHADVTENQYFGEIPDNELWHSLWNSAGGCHYDHEHGDNAFIPEVAAAFPEFDLMALLGGKQIGHTNPSSSIENLHHSGKHGGFEIDVKLSIPGACAEPFEGGEFCITKAVIGFHLFGDASRELIAKTHSAWALFEACRRDNPSVCGQVFVNQLQQYGQMISPYQGFLIPFENNFSPAWQTARGPYWSIGCVFDAPLPGHFGTIDCRDNLTVAYGAPSPSTVSSKVTGTGARPLTSKLLGVLVRTRDNYQLFDTRDLVEPFTFLYLCSADGGFTYLQTRCPYVNATSNAHELAGRIPTEWDGATFDTDSRPGRVSGTFWVTAYGDLAPTCTTARPASGSDLGCYPIQLSGMMVGFYSDQLIGSKSNQFTPLELPSRNICFDSAGVVVSCDEAGAVPSGWIGENN